MFSRDSGRILWTSGPKTQYKEAGYNFFDLLEFFSLLLCDLPLLQIIVVLFSKSKILQYGGSMFLAL